MQIYKIDKVDWHGTGEDREIAGWWFKARRQPRLRLLIKND